MELILLVEVRSYSLSDEDYGNHEACDSYESRHEACSEVALCKERSELVDQECHCVSGAELKSDSSSQPALALHL